MSLEEMLTQYKPIWMDVPTSVSCDYLFHIRIFINCLEKSWSSLCFANLTKLGHNTNGTIEKLHKFSKTVILQKNPKH